MKHIFMGKNWKSWNKCFKLGSEVTFFCVVAQWCNPLTLQQERPCRQSSIPCIVPPLERHDKESRTRLGLLYFCDPSARLKATT